MKIQIDIEMEDIARGVLLEDLKMVLKDIKALESEDYLEDYEKEDLKDFKKIAKALKRLIRYYLFVGEADELIKEVEECVNS